MKNQLYSLRTEAWRTGSARYDAARRLKRRELLSTVSLALFSAISVAIAFLQRIYVISNSPQDNYLTALSACLGIFLLAISLMEWGAANGAKAESLYRNAEELNSFQRKLALCIAKLEAGQAVAWTHIDEIRSEYEAIKARCSYNHEPIDDLYFRASKREAPEFCQKDGSPSISKCSKFWITVRWHSSSIWYFAFFWTVIGIAVAAAFWV